MEGGREGEVKVALIEKEEGGGEKAPGKNEREEVREGEASSEHPYPYSSERS